jgi:hypothetical protein
MMPSLKINLITYAYSLFYFIFIFFEAETGLKLAILCLPNAGIIEKHHCAQTKPRTFFFFFFCGATDGALGLAHARQVLYL